MTKTEMVYCNQGETYYVFEIHDNWRAADCDKFRVYYYDDELMRYYYNEGIEEKMYEMSQRHEKKFEVELWVEIVGLQKKKKRWY